MNYFSNFHGHVSGPVDDVASSVFAGEVIRLPGAARVLTAAVIDRLAQCFAVPVARLERVHEVYDPVSLYERIMRARALISGDPFVLNAAIDLLRPFDVPTGDLYLDAVRLRVVAHNAHQIAAAAPAYFIHRDTWYANPACQWNWWIPVTDTPPDRGFAIYPECFARAVANDSPAFDLCSWEAAGGFQAAVTAADLRVHPGLAATVARESLGPALPIAGASGDVVIFSGHHLHGTVANATGLTRFSLELRTVRGADFANGRGPREVDNHSRGSTFTTMRRIQDLI